MSIRILWCAAAALAVVAAYGQGWVDGRDDERREQWWRERGELDGC